MYNDIIERKYVNKPSCLEFTLSHGEVIFENIPKSHILKLFQCINGWFYHPRKKKLRLYTFNISKKISL